MPSTYHYHLKLELYATPDPAASSSISISSSDRAANDKIWVPSASSSIFDDLPSHPRTREPTPPRPPRQRQDPSQRPEPNKSAHLVSGYTAEAPSPASTGVIDCGASRATAQDNTQEGGAGGGGGSGSGSKRGNLVFLSERQFRDSDQISPPPKFEAGIGPRTAARDWRFGRVRVESLDQEEVYDAVAMEGKMAGKAGEVDGEGGEGGQPAAPAASLGPNLGGMGQATKARYMPLETKNTEAGWGIVHLYREGDESSAMRAVPGSHGAEEGGSNGSGGGKEGEDDGTTLCIPAVPSYLSPSDFLGFIGEKWRGDVSHYRMIMTSRLSRYMVLMRFRNAGIARDWRREFDGKPFDDIGSEICHVTYIRSITVETPNQTDSKRKAPESSGDHFGPASPNVLSSLKPFPPPTPNLIELPTCPVCLERMDDTAGLMTIICQHVFHCTCLQTWKGLGCPVCRATNPTSTQDPYDPNNPYSQPFGSGVSNLCSVCDSTTDLWICLICGKVGCGRYRGGHAKDHWKETAHSFSLELETQHVWDYAGDMWVHRLIRDKGDGKVVELSSNNNNSSRSLTGGQQHEGEGGNEEEQDVVPRAKLENIGLEYTHLLTSQLESQRIYFEEMVNKAVDKAAKAAASAESASASADKALRELATLREDYRVLKEETVPGLERELTRERNRANKSAELARSLGKSLQEEKKVGEGLMVRIEHMIKEAEGVAGSIAGLKAENEDLKEMNRDLSMFISGQEKLKELENEGKVEQGELEEGTASVPEEKKGRGKGKGKGKK